MKDEENKTETEKTERESRTAYFNKIWPWCETAFFLNQLEENGYAHSVLRMLDQGVDVEESVQREARSWAEYALR